MKNTIRQNCLLLLWCCQWLACSHLPPFRLQRHSEHTFFPTTQRYLGYILPGSLLSEQGVTTSAFAIYFWLPNPQSALGVRLLSPSPRSLNQQQQVYSCEIWDEHFAGHRFSAVGFDPAIRLEYCAGSAELTNLPPTCGKWLFLGENDDSDELPRRPDRSASHALLRIHGFPAQPTSPLPVGLYRVVVYCAKTGPVEGSFLLELAGEDLTRAKLAPSLLQLQHVLQSTSTSNLCHQRR